MKKIIMIAAAAVAVVGVALAAAQYSVISLSTKGETPVVGLSVGRLAHVQVEGGYPANGTFVLSRISADSSLTNELVTLTASGGAINQQIGDATNIWVMAGDRLLRSGTVTNVCRVRLVFDGN